MKTHYRIEIKRSSSEYAVKDEDGNWPPSPNETIYTESDTYLRELAQAFFIAPTFPFMAKDFVLEDLPLGKVFSIRGGVKGLTDLGQEQNVIGVRVYVEALEEEPEQVTQDLFAETEVVPEAEAETKKPKPYYIEAALALAKRKNLLDYYQDFVGVEPDNGRWLIKVDGITLLWTLNYQRAHEIKCELYPLPLNV